MADRVQFTIELHPNTVAYLRSLARSNAVDTGRIEDVLAYLAASAADGVRRPGAWECGWCEQAFGTWPDGGQDPNAAYASRLPLAEDSRG